MRRVFIFLVFLCVAAITSFQVFALDYEDYPVVKLRSLDKITARTMTFEAKVGSTVRFGDIFIKVQSCRKPPPIEKSEAAAFLQVWQSNEIKEISKWIFSGWMFASSPALSAMDHPVYDVWVLDCLGRDPEPIPVTNAEAPDKGVPAPATDGAAPNAVPPAVEPDKQKPVPPVDDSAVTPEDDPGAYEDEAVPTTNIPGNATVNPDPAPNTAAPDYAPAQDTPETYKDETPPDDTSPKDDTALPIQPAVPAPAAAPSETLEPKSDKQEFEGIY